MKPIIRKNFIIPPDVIKGLSEGTMFLKGSVVRLVNGRIYRHLKEVPGIRETVRLLPLNGIEAVAGKFGIPLLFAGVALMNCKSHKTEEKDIKKENAKIVQFPKKPKCVEISCSEK